MDEKQATVLLSALSHETRLWAFRILAQAGPQGLSAGEIADTLSSRQNTMSSHLKQLAAARLVTGRRAGRSVMYSANLGPIADLTAYLADDCCAGVFAKPDQMTDSAPDKIPMSDSKADKKQARQVGGFQLLT